MDEGTARIELRRKDAPSLWAVVDEADLGLALDYRWHCVSRKHTAYAMTKVRCPDGSRVTIYLHRLLLDAPPDLDVDHVDHDGLNNRRQNLRLATRGKNLGNTRKLRGGTSQYKGVHWQKRRSSWRAEIKVDRRNIYLGQFPSEHEAAHAYDRAATAAWGEFACLNFPLDSAA